MKNVLLLLLLLPFVLPAQKTEQVFAYLGEARYNFAPDAGRVYYTFSDIEIARKSDGQKTHAQLLPDAPAWKDSGGGKLVRITFSSEAGKIHIIQPSEKKREVARSEVTSAQPIPKEWAYDSLSLAAETERIKGKIGFYNSQLWSAIRPVWGVVIFSFWLLFPILCVIGVGLWFWAKLSAEERFPDIHRAAARIMLLLVGTVWTIFLINSFMTIVYWQMSPLGFFLCMGAVAIIAYKSAAWIIPNFNRSKPQHRENNYPRL